MEETKQNTETVKQADQSHVFYVRNEPIMPAALDVFMLINKHGKGLLKAKGNTIPSAVAIANIIVEKMLHNSVSIERITLDSENTDAFGKRMLSTIEISIIKN
jgi:archaea-specific DNA-binding protein